MQECRRFVAVYKDGRKFIGEALGSSKTGWLELPPGELSELLYVLNPQGDILHLQGYEELNHQVEIYHDIGSEKPRIGNVLLMGAKNGHVGVYQIVVSPPPSFPYKFTGFRFQCTCKAEMDVPLPLPQIGVCPDCQAQATVVPPQKFICPKCQTEKPEAPLYLDKLTCPNCGQDRYQWVMNLLSRMNYSPQAGDIIFRVRERGKEYLGGPVLGWKFSSKDTK